MRVEFRQGVPTGCFEWLSENVGIGNWHGREDGRWQITKLSLKDRPEYTWFYDRTVLVADDTRKAAHYVPTITVKDEKMAIAFVLRWK